MGRTYTIYTATHIKQETLRPETIDFPGLYERLQTPASGAETFAEYNRLQKAERDARKDVGGFVAGKLLDGKRRKGHVLSREIITLDLDAMLPGSTESFLSLMRGSKTAWIAYTTRNHCPEAPRLRVLIPLSRPCSADEYEPLARKVASWLDPTMSTFDKTTFEATRIMYWPSKCKDSEYICEGENGTELDVDVTLADYENWTDYTEWPRCPGEEEKILREAKKQQDPTTKRGVVGDFCRTYDIHAAIEKFLPEVYEPCDVEDRYTYLEGSTAAGAVVYGDGLYLYSHHGTDPACGELLNAFDLVRVHKFGHLDDGNETRITKAPSFAAMKNLCYLDTEVLREVDKNRRIDVSAMFGITDPNPFAINVPQPINPFAGGVDATIPPPVKEVENPFARDVMEFEPSVVVSNAVQGGHDSVTANPFGTSGGTATEPEKEVNPDWEKTLVRNLNTGAIEQSINNYVTILMNDPALKGNIKFNEFSHYGVEAQPGLPWNRSKKVRAWTDTDDSYMRMYIEANYGSYSKDKIFDAINVVSEHNTYDPVRDFIKAEKWDGKPRIETALVDYLGAEDTPYTREVTRKSLVAAVARVMDPGTKFDIMTIIGGPQGIGKSTFLRTISNGWFIDGIKSFDDKDTTNKMRASWIIEMGELAGLNKMETERIKQFLSQNEDVMRLPYGRRVGVYPRRCVFFGTSNNYDYLKDPTGSRRFWPVDAGVNMPTKNVFRDLLKEVPQLWAEAYHYYLKGENIMVLDEKIAKIAEAVQEEHAELSPKTGVIQEFVARKVPADWNTMSVEQRKIFWMSPERHDDPELVDRKKVCAAEVWVECLGKDITSMRPTDTREINGILAKIPEFKSSGGAKPMRFGKFYGTQRGFMRNECK